MAAQAGKLDIHQQSPPELGNQFQDDPFLRQQLQRLIPEQYLDDVNKDLGEWAVHQGAGASGRGAGWVGLMSVSECSGHLAVRPHAQPLPPPPPRRPVWLGSCHYHKGSWEAGRGRDGVLERGWLTGEPRRPGHHLV